ncbi:MAG TPA: diphosphate--fructose-6-phosphate 1-phosphotransferase, partial [Ktedonobacterales bacterium]|nr:diphosphate--fructose-6-phosphate 1-phosphotransferase [Ktedonobacterales bacterium]
MSISRKTVSSPHLTSRPARGHLLIGQSGGATAVINASLAGAALAAMEAEAVDGVYGARYGIRGVLDDDLIDLRRLPMDTWDILRGTPSAALGSCRYKLRDDDAERAVAMLRARGIRSFLYIGGNDSADTALRLAEAARATDYDLRVICVPKTIDNDLPETDHCPGYGSAARFLALAARDSALCTLAMPDHYPIKIIEVMGRDVGWLAASSALCQEREEDPPHLIYFPERPLSEERFLADVSATHAAYGCAVVVVAETVRDEQGRALGATGSQGVDAFGHLLLGGAAQYLTSLVRERLGLRARFDKPGDLQRMSSACVSTADRAEAELVGRAAVEEALRGESGKMVTLVRRPGPEYVCDTGLADLAKIANAHRPFPSAFLSTSGTGVTQAYRDYALPLLGEPLPGYLR